VGKAWFAHLGDSRLYHFRDGKLLFRTKDHSVAELLVAQGELRESEVAGHPDQGRLLKSIGGGGDFVPPKTGEADVAPGDVFILCTDGFWQRGRIERLARLASRPGMDLQRLAETEAARAVKRNGPQGDNTTVVVVVVTPEPHSEAKPQRRSWLSRLLGSKPVASPASPPPASARGNGLKK